MPLKWVVFLTSIYASLAREQNRAMLHIIHTKKISLKAFRIAFVMGMIFLFSLGMIATTPAAFADGPGGNVGDPVVRAVDIAQPAVVRILTGTNAQLTVHFSNGQDATFPQNSNGYPITLSGTGAFISAHGDILTADHVVNPPRADLDQFLYQTAAPDVANYMNQVLKANPQVSADQVYQALLSGQLGSTSQYSTFQSDVFLSTAFSGPINAPNFQSIPRTQYAPVDRIEKESSFNQDDVAIIHVSGMDDMPMLQLGDSSGVQVQDQLTIIGFPGNGDVSMAPTNLLTSSVNIVTVSSIKTTDAGAPVIQVGGNVEHGDSGGPALDSQGNVVGIVSFGAAGPGNTSFLQASNSARKLVQALGLDTTPGRFQKLWSQAFNDYAAKTPGHWHKAVQEFQELQNQYPLFKAVQPFLHYAQTQASTEKTTSTPPTNTPGPSTAGSNNTWLLIGGAAVVLLVLLLFGAVMLRRRSQPAVAQRPSSYVGQPPVGQIPRAEPITPPGQHVVVPPPQRPYSPPMGQDLSAFGAPSTPPSWPRSSTMPSNSQAGPPHPTNAMVPWPCGHMNRSYARFCSVCGEPAPQQPTVRRFEQ
jgi:LPXTG-motif cell wall-anchored protein